jgi:hypothetical protein
MKRTRDEGEQPARLPPAPGGEAKAVQFNTLGLAYLAACQRATAAGETFPVDLQAVLSHPSGTERIK